MKKTNEKRFGSDVLFWIYLVTLMAILAAFMNAIHSLQQADLHSKVEGYTVEWGSCSFADCENEAVWHCGRVVSKGRIAKNANYQVNSYGVVGNSTTFSRMAEGSVQPYTAIEGAYCRKHRYEGQKLIQSALRNAYLRSALLLPMVAMLCILISFVMTVARKKY